MTYFLRFAWVSALYVLLPIVFIIVLLQYKWKKNTTYRYSLGSTLRKQFMASAHPHKKILWLTRFFVLLLLAFLIAQPQLVDSRSNVSVEGIDIVLVLDASGSMQYQDLDNDKRSRFDVAKDEAIRFVAKRDDDAIGLVLFGNDALSRCPITHDKKIVSQMIQELKLGDIDPDGTKLSTAIVTAANRLKHSKAQSKVMILLTDGEPSPGDMEPSVAIEVAKKLGIKVYTIGIGSDDSGFIRHPLYGLVPKQGINKNLLKAIAQQTGGQFFLAHDAQDMREIYNTIDTLERTRHESPIFSRYFHIFAPLTGALIGIFSVELLLSTFVWFGV